MNSFKVYSPVSLSTFILLKDLYLFTLCVCEREHAYVYVCVCSAYGGQERVSDPWELKLEAPVETWVLGPELGSL